MKLKCLIIDDEPDAVRLLQKVLLDFCADQTEIIASASNSLEGAKLITRFNPDLVFMDIEMPGASGFDLVDIQAHDKNCKIVFVTAYDKHAVRAIKYKPEAYLLKPIDIDELKTTVVKIYNQKFEEAKPSLPMGKYSISVKDETILADLSEILFVKALGRYSDVYMTNNRTIRICKNIGSFEKDLGQNGFIRCHKSYLVNQKHILKFSKTDGGFIEISNGTSIEISRRKKNLLFGQHNA